MPIIKPKRLHLTSEQQKLLNLIQKQERAVIKKIQDLKVYSFSDEELKQNETILRKSSFEKIFGDYGRLQLYDILTGKEFQNFRKRAEQDFLIEYLSLIKIKYLKMKKLGQT